MYALIGLTWTVLFLTIGPAFYYLTHRSKDNSQRARTELDQLNHQQSEIGAQLSNIQTRMAAIERLLKTVE